MSSIRITCRRCKYGPAPASFSLQSRLESFSPDEVAITAIAVEEQMRGWMALIRATPMCINRYLLMNGIKLFDFFGQWQILPFNRRAADAFTLMRGQGVRIGAMDLKIASIVVVTGGTLLSANIDFQKVPGMRVENWLQT